MRADLGDDRPQAADIAVGGQQFQAVIDARAGAQQQRKVAGENRDVLGPRLVEQAETAPRRGVFHRERFDQHQAEALDAPRHVSADWPAIAPETSSPLPFIAR